MAAYWKAVSVYAGHLHRIARPSEPTKVRQTRTPSRKPSRRSSNEPS
jgi:hypothetical protein